MSIKEGCYKFYWTGLYNNAFLDWRVAQNHTFSNVQLFLLKPHQVFAYFANLAHGTPTPTVNDTPTKTRGATLEIVKKAISSLQPNCFLHWNEQSNSGNSTQSAQMNDLIKQIKKEELSL